MALEAANERRLPSGGGYCPCAHLGLLVPVAEQSVPKGAYSAGDNRAVDSSRRSFRPKTSSPAVWRSSLELHPMTSSQLEGRERGARHGDGRYCDQDAARGNDRDLVLPHSSGCWSDVQRDCRDYRRTVGDDDLTGTAGPDVIVALEGRDVIHALDGSDIVCPAQARIRRSARKATITSWRAKGQIRRLRVHNQLLPKQAVVDDE